MYELLEIPSNASYPEVKIAHENLTRKLQDRKNDLNREDIDYRLNLINVAYHTLSNPMLRDSYDAQLANASASVNIPSQHNIVPLQNNIEAMALKAEAMSLKAEAMSLKAEAMSLKTTGAAFKLPAVSQVNEDNHESNLTMISSTLSAWLSPFKKIFITLGTLIAMYMVIQVIFLLLFNKQSERVVNAASQADEKVFIQQYYQETGIRVASKAEADLLDKERNLLDKEKRDAESEERAEKDKERKYNQFVEESRRRGEQVSEELRRGEEQAQREEERKRLRLEEEKRRQEEDEIRRIEREKARWKSY